LAPRTTVGVACTTSDHGISLKAAIQLIAITRLLIKMTLPVGSPVAITATICYEFLR
jgi:hypothetical protein